MRISDWSSDVCSSDLDGGLLPRRRLVEDDQDRRGLPGDDALAVAPLAVAFEDGKAVGKARRHLLVEEARPLGRGDRRAAGALGAEVELQPGHGEGAVAAGRLEIGRASCRERVCQYV